MEKVSGIIIKRVVLNDNDIIVTIFTKEKGKIQAIAKGAKKTKSQFIGTTQLFCYCNFVYFPGKTFAHINQTELIESFYKLRNDLSILSAASYLIEILNITHEEGQKDERVLNLLLYSLSLLTDNKDKNVKLVVLAYQLKFMALMGYAPNLKSCSKCLKEYDEYYLSKKSGGIICKKCKQINNFDNTISIEGLIILNTLLYCDLKKVGELQCNLNLLNYLIKLMNEYITYHIDKKIYSYEFLEII
ncbi:DNA repair protein RecO [Alkalibaculum sp. M08DMB]|uniref:DNA repair protein RecO n=1 Tax=Alkalibaculum sporogenes TaxID=2655001 RepID=A0A6A7KC80_9FIRM|nr:DNA repair protein RecO [Alkalibaculum sporogenes]MPW27034.1 DNA repair protein RecO [Alkalibaculum sporogenes]